MISVSNNQTQRIFLSSKTVFKSLESKKIEIIVSPEFYWVRKFNIPVKNETQARHVLPTLFEDIIDEKSTLTYSAIRLENNEFLCFAYSNKKVYEAIKNAGIPTSNISSVYFAQNECHKFKSFVSDDLSFIYTKENILVKVPNNIIVQKEELTKGLKTIKLSNHKLQIKFYNNILNSKIYYSFLTIFSIIIFLNLVKSFSYSNQADNLLQKEKELKVAASLPASKIQTKAILEKYEKTINDELSKRKAIQYIISNQKHNLKSLVVFEKNIELEYLNANKSEIENFLTKKFKLLSSNKNSFTLNVKVSYE